MARRDTRRGDTTMSDVVPDAETPELQPDTGIQQESTAEPESRAEALSTVEPESAADLASPPRAEATRSGTLTVIGTGIKTVGQLTHEAVASLYNADCVLYVVGDLIAESVLKQLSPNGATSLADYYKVGEPRINAYNAMIEHILGCVRAGNRTVAAFYGHPGVFAYPSHESVRRARLESYEARMLPGISAEDCMFADLGIDPAISGCQSYEATDFLLNAPVIDSSSQLILWQIGTLGDWTYKTTAYDTRAMPLMMQKLARYYPITHPVTVYEAAMLPNVRPMIAQIPLYALSSFPITAAMTLYVPPARARERDLEMMRLFQQMMS